MTDDRKKFPLIYEKVNNEDRLRDLHSYNILDTPSEVFYDKLTSILKDLYKIKVIGIILVDKDRQWFKSLEGLNITETDISLSFCKHLIADENMDMLIIPDARKDERFKENRLVLEAPNIRYYAAVPLITDMKNRIGAICMIDDKIRPDINESDIKLLEFLANATIKYMESSKNINTLTDYNQWLITIK